MFSFVEYFILPFIFTAAFIILLRIQRSIQREIEEYERKFINHSTECVVINSQETNENVTEIDEKNEEVEEKRMENDVVINNENNEENITEKKSRKVKITFTIDK